MNSAGAAQVIHLLKLGPHSPLRQGSRTFSASSRILAAIGGRGKALATDSYVCVQVAIPREQIYAIREHLPVNEAATEYAGQLLRLDEQVLPRNAEGECSHQFASAYRVSASLQRKAAKPFKYVFVLWGRGKGIFPLQAS